ncbi:MAG: Flp family type IVb pilin [Amaricoccus sp.]|nr:Flp family type IVb pilin [Amaricoccus sp.]
MEFARRLRKDDDGATAIEYGLLAALIAVGIISAVGILGDNLRDAFDEVNQELVDGGSPGAVGSAEE